VVIANPVPVAAYWIIKIGMLPVYKQVDPLERKCLKQAIFKFILCVGPFILFCIYYQFNPQTTGIDRIVSKPSHVFTFVSITGVVLSSSYFKIKTRDK